MTDRSSTKVYRCVALTSSSSWRNFLFSCESRDNSSVNRSAFSWKHITVTVNVVGVVCIFTISVSRCKLWSRANSPSKIRKQYCAQCYSPFVFSCRENIRQPYKGDQAFLAFHHFMDTNNFDKSNLGLFLRRWNISDPTQTMGRLPYCMSVPGSWSIWAKYNFIARHIPAYCYRIYWGLPATDYSSLLKLIFSEKIMSGILLTLYWTFLSSVSSSAAWSRSSTPSMSSAEVVVPSVGVEVPAAVSFNPFKPDCNTDDSRPDFWTTHEHVSIVKLEQLFAKKNDR